jgi:ribonucleases P/MRP protein subunit RPP40
MPLFDFDSAGRRESKTRVHVGYLPPYIHSEQPPTKKSPWRTVSDAPFLKIVNMILPEELYDLIWDKIEGESKKASYAKVILKLQDIISGTFFTEYVKKGRSSSSISCCSWPSRRFSHLMEYYGLMCHMISSSLIFAGNVLMLSEGRPGIDNVFSLRDGKASISHPSICG